MLSKNLNIEAKIPVTLKTKNNFEKNTNYNNNYSIFVIIIIGRAHFWNFCCFLPPNVAEIIAVVVEHRRLITAVIKEYDEKLKNKMKKEREREKVIES